MQELNILLSMYHFLGRSLRIRSSKVRKYIKKEENMNSKSKSRQNRKASTQTRKPPLHVEVCGRHCQIPDKITRALSLWHTLDNFQPQCLLCLSISLPWRLLRTVPQVPSVIRVSLVRSMPRWSAVWVSCPENKTYSLNTQGLHSPEDKSQLGSTHIHKAVSITELLSATAIIIPSALLPLQTALTLRPTHSPCFPGPPLRENRYPQTLASRGTQSKHEAKEFLVAGAGNGINTMDRYLPVSGFF